MSRNDKLFTAKCMQFIALKRALHCVTNHRILHSVASIHNQYASIPRMPIDVCACFFFFEKFISITSETKAIIQSKAYSFNHLYL